jgi:hypothetical protein
MHKIGKDVNNALSSIVHYCKRGMLKEIKLLNIDYEKLTCKLSEVKKHSSLKNYLGCYVGETGSINDLDYDIMNELPSC